VLKGLEWNKTEQKNCLSSFENRNLIGNETKTKVGQNEKEKKSFLTC
jgi:hypothetical protein